jgi:hypothetical protein
VRPPPHSPSFHHTGPPASPAFLRGALRCATYPLRQVSALPSKVVVSTSSIGRAIAHARSGHPTAVYARSRGAAFFHGGGPVHHATPHEHTTMTCSPHHEVPTFSQAQLKSAHQSAYLLRCPGERFEARVLPIPPFMAHRTAALTYSRCHCQQHMACPCPCPA